MDFSIKNALQFALAIALCAIFLISLSNYRQSFKQKELLASENQYDTAVIENSDINISVDSIALKINQEYSLYDYIDIEGATKEDVIIYDNIDIHTRGYYKARFLVKGSHGNQVDKTVEVRVDE